MPASKKKSPKQPEPLGKLTLEDIANVDELWGTTPVEYDPAILAAILRGMGNVEMELFKSGLTKHQLKLMDRIRHYRGIIYRMIPEGS